MTIWLIRAGSHGEHEQKFISENRVYLTWDDLDQNLSELNNREDLKKILMDYFPDKQPNAISNWVSQIWPFAHEIKKNDLVILPLKSQPAIYIGEVTGEYKSAPNSPNPYFHWLPVKWIGESIPRTHFGKDLLYSFGAFLTICRIQRNNAEERIKAMYKNGWKPETISSVIRKEEPATDESTDLRDIEEMARDQIAALIESQFKGHGLTRLVENILKAQGYTTYRSPEGPDGGVDILAGAGPLGFGSPRLCVEVKSESNPIDRTSVDKLLGAISKFQADEGLFVSWSGFKATVPKELASSFFKVRLWTQKELLEHLFSLYEHLDDDIKADLPLKRIWTVACGEES